MSDVLQKQFKKFHENIKLKRFDENQTLRDKRDIIIDRLKSGLKEIFEDQGIVPIKWDWFNQGSYDIGTGVKPLDSDYDIDIGLRFYISKDKYGPVEAKKWVKDALDGHTKEVRIKEPCITVQYSVDDEPTYHVDLAIYSYDEGLFFEDEYYLARGKENSLEENKFWEDAAPKKLADKLKGRFSDEEDKQYRRIVRYLKRWKDVKFSSEGNSAPTGIGFTVAAYNWFTPEISLFTGKPNDLTALRNFVNSVINNFGHKYDADEGEYCYRLEVKIPVKPYSDIFEKMTNNQMSELKSKLEKLKNSLDKTIDESDPHEAAKILEKEFGDDFPIPEKKDTAQTKKAAISTSTTQA